MKKGLRKKFLGDFKLLFILCLLKFSIGFGAFAGTLNSRQVEKLINFKATEFVLADLLKEIESKTEFSFFYDKNLDGLTQHVHLSSENTNLKTVLDEVSEQVGLVFKQVGTTLLIKEVSAGEQPEKKPKHVSGKVTTENGEPLPGVTVNIAGTTNGVITNIDGEFVIDVLPGKKLSFSFIGYEKQVVRVDTKTDFQIVMRMVDETLDEVVVTAIGIKRSEKALGYSVSGVKSDQIDNSNVNLLSSLQGKVTGVNITSMSNDPGASVLMNIRGATSLDISNSSLNSQPLYVVDGVPVSSDISFYNKVDMGNAISDLNPNDIESITVLKGASAAALYGSSAGNGVIMITTKAGSRRKKGISIEYGLTTLANTAYKTLELQKEFAGGDRDTYIYSSVDDGWGPGLADGGITGKRWNIKTQEWETDVILTGTKEDRVKEFLRTGLTLINNVTITSNRDNEVFRLSYNNTRNEGVVPNTATYKNSISFTGLKKVRDDLTVSIKANFLNSYIPNRAITTGPQSEDNVIANLYSIANQIQPVSDMTEYWLDESEGIYPNPIMFDGDDAGYKNPYWIVNEHINSSKKNWTFGRIQADWQIIDPLSVTFRSGMDFKANRYESHVAWGYSDDYPKGYYDASNSSYLATTTDVILNLKKQFKNFSLASNVGYTYKYSSSSSTGVTATALSRPNDYSISNAASGNDSSSSSWSKSRQQSVFGTAQLGYKGMGYLEVTGRKDWGGILEEDKNSYFYPSASLSIIPSTILELPSWVNFAKLRIGVAQVGHGIGTPRNTDSYSFKSYDWRNATLVGISGTLVDANLKPEKTNSIEFGTDFNLFENRLKADFTVFRKSHNNQLLSVSVPQTSGFSSMTTNVGDVVSKGYEWSLSLVPVQTKNLSWTFSTNFSRAVATVDRLSSNFGDYEMIGVSGYLRYKLAEGEKIGNMYQKYEPVLVKEGKYKGMYIIRWENGEGFERTTNDDEKKCIGNYNPDFVMGFNTNIRYKNWTLNIVTNLRYGGKYVSRTLGYLGSRGFLPETLKGGTKYSSGWAGGRNAEYGGYEWPEAGSGANSVVNARISDLRRSGLNDAVYLKGVYVDPDSGLDYDDDNAGDENYIVNGEDPTTTLWSTSEDAAYDWIYKFASNRALDATNFKIKEVSLTYQFDRKMIQKLKLQKLSFSLIARNVFHWYASGLNEDPETAFKLNDGSFNQGTSRFTLPPIASWGFQLNIGL
jgi:TonB-linked SusC/RagA family outer membrane protein